MDLIDWLGDFVRVDVLDDSHSVLGSDLKAADTREAELGQWCLNLRCV